MLLTTTYFDTMIVTIGRMLTEIVDGYRSTGVLHGDNDSIHILCLPDALRMSAPHCMHDDWLLVQYPASRIHTMDTHVVKYST